MMYKACTRKHQQYHVILCYGCQWLIDPDNILTIKCKKIRDRTNATQRGFTYRYPFSPAVRDCHVKMTGMFV